MSLSNLQAQTGPELSWARQGEMAALSCPSLEHSCVHLTSAECTLGARHRRKGAKGGEGSVLGGFTPPPAIYPGQGHRGALGQSLSRAPLYLKK